MNPKNLLVLFFCIIFIAGSVFAFMDIEPSTGPGAFHSNGCDPNGACNWDGLELSDSLGLSGSPPVGGGTYRISHTYNGSDYFSPTPIGTEISVSSLATRDAFYATNSWGAASVEHYSSYITNDSYTDNSTWECTNGDGSPGSGTTSEYTASVYGFVRQHVAVLGRGGWSMQKFSGFAGPYYCGQSKTGYNAGSETGADPHMKDSNVPINDANAFVVRPIYPYSVAYYYDLSLHSYVRIGVVAPTTGTAGGYVDFAGPIYTVGKNSLSFTGYNSTKSGRDPVTNEGPMCITDNSLSETQSGDGNMDSYCYSGTSFYSDGTSYTYSDCIGQYYDIGSTLPLQGRSLYCLDPEGQNAGFSESYCGSIAPGGGTGSIDSYRSRGWKVRVLTYVPTETAPPAFTWPSDEDMRITLFDPTPDPDRDVGGLESWALGVYVGWSGPIVQDYSPIVPPIDPGCPADYPYNCSNFDQCHVEQGGDCGPVEVTCAGCCDLCTSGPCTPPSCTTDGDCPSGQSCVDGSCIDPTDPCDGVICPGGQVCVEGSCVPDCSALAGNDRFCCENPTSPSCVACSGLSGDALTCCMNPADPICVDPCTGGGSCQVSCNPNTQTTDPIDGSCNQGGSVCCVNNPDTCSPIGASCMAANFLGCSGYLMVDAAGVCSDITNLCCKNPIDPVCSAGETCPGGSSCDPLTQIPGSSQCGSFWNPKSCCVTVEDICSSGGSCKSSCDAATEEVASPDGSCNVGGGSVCCVNKTPDYCTGGGSCQASCDPNTQTTSAVDGSCNQGGSVCCVNNVNTCTADCDNGSSCPWGKEAAGGTCADISQSCCRGIADIACNPGFTCESSSCTALQTADPLVPRCGLWVSPSNYCCQDLSIPTFTCDGVPANPDVGAPVVWSVSATGGSLGVEDFDYSWVGNVGNTSSTTGPSITSLYSSPGNKSVTVVASIGGSTAGSATCDVVVKPFNPDDCTDLGGTCKTSPCPTGETNIGTCTGSGNVCCVSGPIDDCDITSFLAGDLLVDNSVNLLFACEPTTNSANILLKDTAGNYLSSGSNLTCAPTEDEFTNYKFNTSQLKGIYSATLSTALCSRDIFFTVNEKGEVKNVADNNIIVVLLLVCLVVFIISSKRRK